MTDFNLLDPRNAAVFLPMDGSFRQDVGPNLVTDGDMESLVGWTAQNNATLTIQPGGVVGNCIRIVRNGVNGASAIQNVGMTVGFMYSAEGWYRGDGVNLPLFYLGAPALGSYGVASNVWRGWTLVGTVATSWVYCRTSSTVDGGYSEFDEVSVYERPIVTRSLSRAQNYARLGDGHTAATMPTLLPRRGYSFDGGDYINLDWAAGGALDTQTFTVCSLVAPTIPVADGRIYEIGIAGARYSLFYDLSEGDLVWQKDDTVDQTITSGYGYPDGSAHVVCASISSTAMNLYVDDRLVGSLAGDLRLASFNAASKAYFGQDVAGGNRMKGKMFGGAVYPFELTLAQVREWGRRARQMRNL